MAPSFQYCAPNTSTGDSAIARCAGGRDARITSATPPIAIAASTGQGSPEEDSGGGQRDRLLGDHRAHLCSGEAQRPQQDDLAATLNTVNDMVLTRPTLEITQEMSTTHANVVMRVIPTIRPMVERVIRIGSATTLGSEEQPGSATVRTRREPTHPAIAAQLVTPRIGRTS